MPSYAIRLDLPADDTFGEDTKKELELDLYSDLQRFMNHWIYDKAKITQDARADIEENAYVMSILP